MSNQRIDGLKLGVGVATALAFTAVFLIAYTGRSGTYFAYLRHVPGGDKTGHVLLIGFLGFVLSWLSGFRAWRPGRWPVPYGIVVVFVFITIEEFVQQVSPHRSFDLMDLLCNYIGLGLALGLVAWCRGRPRVEEG